MTDIIHQGLSIILSYRPAFLVDSRLEPISWQSEWHILGHRASNRSRTPHPFTQGNVSTSISAHTCTRGAYHIVHSEQSPTLTPVPQALFNDEVDDLPTAHNDNLFRISNIPSSLYQPCSRFIILLNLFHNVILHFLSLRFLPHDGEFNCMFDLSIYLDGARLRFRRKKRE